MALSSLFGNATALAARIQQPAVGNAATSPFQDPHRPTPLNSSEELNRRRAADAQLAAAGPRAGGTLAGGYSGQKLGA